MISLLVSLAVLLAGFLIYGRITEKDVDDILAKYSN